MRQRTDHKLPSNSRWIGEARGHTREQLRSQALRRRRWSVALFASLLVPLLLDTPRANRLARTSKTKTRSCLPRSGRFVAGS